MIDNDTQNRCKLRQTMANYTIDLTSETLKETAGWETNRKFERQAVKCTKQIMTVKLAVLPRIAS